MTKKAATKKVSEAGSPRKARRLPATPSAAPDSSIHLGALSTVLSPDVARGDEHGLQILLSAITDNLGDQGIEKAQLHEFLGLILDTDPALKEEIMRGIRVRK